MMIMIQLNEKKCKYTNHKCVGDRKKGQIIMRPSNVKKNVKVKMFFRLYYNFSITSGCRGDVTYLL